MILRKDYINLLISVASTLFFLSSPALAIDPDGLIVKTRSGATQQCLTWLNVQCGAKEIQTIDQNLFLVRFPQSINPEHMLAVYQDHPEVEYAEPNYALSQDPMESNPIQCLQIQSLKAASAPQASPRTIVAVLDTGVDYTHPDLKQAMWINPGEDLNGNGQIDSAEINGVDNDGDALIDNFYGACLASLNGDGPDPLDKYGHGTHVAGIILQNALNPNGENTVALMAVKFLSDSGKGYLSDAAKGISFAIEHGAQIINCSFGYPYNSTTLQNIMQQAEEKGIVVVAAAGNYNSETPLYPAYYAHSIAVAAVDSDGYKASFSNYGAHLDIAVEGVNIYSTYLNGAYATMSGTSMATPKVSGLLAVALNRQPSLTAAGINQALATAAKDVLDPLKTGALYVGKDKYTGYGILELNPLLLALSSSVDPTLKASAFSSSDLANLMNYPNPVSAGASTTFGFSADTNVNVTLKVYSQRGQLLRTLATSKTPASSYVKVVYDCTDERGSRLPMDVYFYLVEAQDTAGTVARGKGKLVVIN